MVGTWGGVVEVVVVVVHLPFTHLVVVVTHLPFSHLVVELLVLVFCANANVLRAARAASVSKPFFMSFLLKFSPGHDACWS
jgi:hypothetical protein